MMNQLIRYLAVRRLIEKNDCESILEVGSGHSGLGNYLNKKFVGCDPWLSNFKEIGFNINSNLIPVAASALALPFFDKSFDVVVSVDMLEHLGGSFRERVIKEMCRVAKKKVIICFPCDKKALWCDRKLSKYYKLKKNIEPAWLKEHLSYDFPTSREVSNILDKHGYDFVMVGNENIYFHYLLMLMESYGVLRNKLAIIANLIGWNKTRIRQLSLKARMASYFFHPLTYLARIIDIGETYRKIFIVYIG